MDSDKGRANEDPSQENCKNHNVRRSFGRKLIFIFILPFLLTACNTRYLQEGEKLYIGSEVTINADGKIKDPRKRKHIKRELEGLIRPEPNKRFLRMRPALWFYNIAGQPKGKGLRYFLRNKAGEPPVLYSNFDPERNRKIIQNRLENQGYFITEVSYEPKEVKKKKMKVFYTVNLSPAYTIAKVTYPQGDSGVPLLIRNSTTHTLLIPGDRYDLQTIKKERERIDEYLKDRGYYYFNSDYILYRVDSTLGDRKVQLNLILKEETPRQALRPYRINRVLVFPRGNVPSDSARRRRFFHRMDTSIVEGVEYIGNQRRFRPEIVVRSIFVRPDSLYRRSNYEISLNRLMAMGTFKFVNIRFRDIDSASNADTGKLDAFVLLTPMAKRSVRLDFKMVTKSNNFVGPQMSIIFRNRNLFRGAELFTLNLNASFETLISEKENGIFSYVIGIKTGLDYPRFLVPFRVKDPGKKFLPHTNFGLGLERLTRVNLYTMTAASVGFGYRWNSTERITFEVHPININFLQLSNTTPQFNEIVGDNISLQRAFQSQFLLGGAYSFTYNTQISGVRRHDVFFYTTFDPSGNLMHLGQSLFNDRKSTPNDPYKIFGYPYSQFLRSTFDFRHYLHINRTRTKLLASRMFVGIGIPYGNSSVLPYAVQFYSGGNNSIRGFAARSIGPGTFRSTQPNDAFFIDQAGDIKLEANTEYRYPIIGVIKGAFFLDMGNIWLAREDTLRPGGLFKFGNVLSEFAVATGFGLRLDVSYFVLRFDLGIPLRKPFLPPGQRWVIGDIDFFNSDWRRENLILNIAIGYPF